MAPRPPIISPARATLSRSWCRGPNRHRPRLHRPRPRRRGRRRPARSTVSNPRKSPWSNEPWPGAATRRGRPRNWADALELKNTDPELLPEKVPENLVAVLGSRVLRHKGAVVALRFLADNTLVSLGKDNTVRFWDAKDGRQRRLCEIDTEAFSGCALSPDGSALALGYDRTGLVKLWDLENEREVHSLPNAADRGVLFPGIEFSPDGTRRAPGEPGVACSRRSGRDGRGSLPSLPSPNAPTHLPGPRARVANTPEPPSRTGTGDGQAGEDAVVCWVTSRACSRRRGRPWSRAPWQSRRRGAGRSCRPRCSRAPPSAPCRPCR